MNEQTNQQANGEQMSGGKFGLEIHALTEARSMAEAESYSPASREKYETAMQENAALIARVGKYLEKKGALAVSDCGSDMFGVITSDKNPDAPCGVTFFGSEKLAEAVASAFPKNKVISASDGEVIAPVLTSVAKSKSARRPKQ
jgi:hypothetical protein